MDLVIAVPVIMAIVEGLKKMGVPKKYSFGVSLVSGIALFGLLCTGALADCLFEGLVASLTASGLYSGAVKPVLK